MTSLAEAEDGAPAQGNTKFFQWLTDTEAEAKKAGLVASGPPTQVHAATAA